MHKELKQISLRKKPFFSLSQLQRAILENPACTAQKAIFSPYVCQRAAMRPVRTKQAHFWFKGRFFSSGNAGSLIRSVALPPLLVSV